MSDTTPLPWHASRKSNFINSGRNENIAVMSEGPRKEADAALIARAVNCHDKLTQALQGLLEWADEYLQNDKCPTYDALHGARVALLATKLAYSDPVS